MPFETFSGFKKSPVMTNQFLQPWIEPESWTHTKKHFVLLIHLRDIGWAENDINRDAAKEPPQ